MILLLWADCVGNEKIKLLQKNSFISFSYLKNIIKGIFFVGINSNYKLKSFKRNIINVENIIYSYCSKGDFNKKGEFYDKYFNFKSSRSDKTIFFLISLDNYIPKNSNNTYIIYKERNNYNLIYIFKEFLKKKSFKKNFFIPLTTHIIFQKFVQIISNLFLKMINSIFTYLMKTDHIKIL